MSGLTLEKGHRFSVPGWKWMPPKTVMVVYRDGPWIVIKIEGEARPQVLHIDDTDDWTPVLPGEKQS